MKQRIRPLLLLKKQLGAFQRVRSGTYAIGNRQMNEAIFGAIRGQAARMGATQDKVIVTYSKTPVNFTDMTGMTITVNGVDDLSATLPTLNGNEVTYTLTSLAATDVDVVWRYVGGGTIVDGDGDPLRDGALYAQKKNPITVNGWATESGDDWLTESGDRWILE